MHYVPPPSDLREARADRIQTLHSGFVRIPSFAELHRMLQDNLRHRPLRRYSPDRRLPRLLSRNRQALFARQISADLAIVIAVVAAMSVGEYFAAAEAMFIMLIGEGLESSCDS